MGDAMFGAGQDASLADLAFTPPLVPGVGLVEMITGAMSPAGELWMSWTAYPAAGHTAARMGNPILGWAGVPVGAFLDGQPCECCPMDFRFDPTGAPLTAWRHNVDNVRNMAVAKGEAGAHTMPLASIATSTDWFIMACPTQGPRLSFRDDASTWIAWSDMSSGEGRAYVAPSRDGLSYDAEIMVAPDLDALQQSPVLAHGPSGMMYLAFQTEHWGGAMLTTSADGVSWSAPMTLTSPEGHLGSIEIERAGDQVVLVGATDVAEGGSVWLAVLE
jgi:hypothetical protein